MKVKHLQVLPLTRKRLLCKRRSHFALESSPFRKASDPYPSGQSGGEALCHLPRESLFSFLLAKRGKARAGESAPPHKEAGRRISSTSFLTVSIFALEGRFS